MAIKEAEKGVERVRDRLARWLADLSSRSSNLDATLDDLQSRSSLWRLTRDHESAAALPKELVQQVEDTIKILADAESQVLSARDSILTLQASVAQQKSSVDAVLDQQQTEITTRTKGAFGIDSPPLWRAFGSAEDGDSASRQFEATQREHWRSLKTYVTQQSEVLFVWLLAWPALALLLVVMHRKAKALAQQDPSLETAVKLLSRPVAAALVVTVILNELLNLRAPAAWIGTLSLMLVLAVLRLAPVLVPKGQRLGLFLVALLYLLQQAAQLAPEGFAIHRLALLALAAVGIATCVWLLRALQADPGNLSKSWHQAVLYGARLALTAFAVGAVADVLGSVEFATLAISGTAKGLLVAVLMVLVTAILRSIVRVALLTDWASRMGIAPDHSATVRTTVFRMISFLAIVGWAVATLQGFLLLDPLFADLRQALAWKITISQFSIAPGDILIFGFLIWLSFKIAEFVQFILDVDLLPRADLPKGVPQTISRISRYAVIAVGAVIASAAVGLDISKAAIVLSALSVGLGFGLQNIVNNFVSGLILLFERPIRVGDTLDLENTGGVVETIGMRASIVSTWDGAEVVIPNANLISEDVVNWTLNHDRRRMSIPVGVAYGTDPERAAKLIVDVANDHKDVDAHPEPTCLFIDFGDSALELELRAWTAGSAYMSVASDLRFAIFSKLTEVGIEIPFPQREIHLRTTTLPEVPADSAGETVDPDPES